MNYSTMLVQKNIIQNLELFSDRKMENLSKQHGGVYEILYYQKNGQGIWLQEEIVSIRNEQNIIVLFLVTFRDITPFKEPLEGQSVMSNLSKFARLAWTITRARPNNNLAPSRYVLVRGNSMDRSVLPKPKFGDTFG